MTRAKIAIFYTDCEAEWVKPWKNFAEMGKKVLEQGRILANDQDLEVEYRIFDVYHGQFPDLNEITRANGYIGLYITGSRSDSFDTETKWIVDFRKLLKVILSDDRFPPVAGVCFGHQIIAAALGSKVGRNPKGFEGGVVTVTLNSNGEKLFQGLKSLNISEMHKDVVFEVPQGYVNWGSTSQCDNQGFYKPTRVITFQGHPEFSSEIEKWGLQNIPQDIGQEALESCDSLVNDGALSASFIWKLFKSRL